MRFLLGREGRGNSRDLAPGSWCWTQSLHFFKARRFPGGPPDFWPPWLRGRVWWWSRSSPCLKGRHSQGDTVRLLWLPGLRGWDGESPWPLSPSDPPLPDCLTPNASAPEDEAASCSPPLPGKGETTPLWGDRWPGLSIKCCPSLHSLVRGHWFYLPRLEPIRN